MEKHNKVIWKKGILAIVFIFVLLRIFYICIRGELNKNYYISQEVDISNAVEIPCQNVATSFLSDQSLLDSLEVIFSGIGENRTGQIVLKITSNDELIYQTNISLTNINNREWKRIFINAELTSKEYCIHLDVSDDCVQIPNILIVPKEDSSPESILSYNGEQAIDGIAAIQFGFLKPPSFGDRAVTSSLWIIFFLCILAFLHYYEKILLGVGGILELIYKKVPKELFIIITELFLCKIIVDCSGIQFQPPTAIILYLISLFATIGIYERRLVLNEICDTTIKKMFSYFLYLYAAFSLVGQRIFIYPLDLRVTVPGLLVYIVAVFWFIPIIQTIFYLLERSSSWLISEKQFHNMIFILISVLVLLLPAIYNLFANNPGISTYDTALTMSEKAHLLYGYDDWHPFFYSLVLRGILNIWDSTYAVIITQYILWIYVMLEFLLYLREKKIKDSFLIMLAVFIGFNAANFLHLNSIWKDIPYALFLFWTLILLAKLSIDYKKYCKRWYIYLELLIAMVGIFFFRKNGIVPFVIIFLMLLLFLRKNIKIWCTLAITMLLIVVIKGPVYSHFGVTGTGYHGMYIGLGQEILGVYYSGGEVSEKTLKLITTMTDRNNAEYNYSPVYSNAAYDLYVEPQEFICDYIDTFVKNPILTIHALINRIDAIWDIYAGEGCSVNLVNFHGTVPYESFFWNVYYPERVYVSLYDTMAEITKYTASSQWISAIQWRGGILTLLGFAVTIYLFIKKGIQKYILIVAPVVGQVLSLLLSTGWSDFRYFWPLNLMNMAIVMLAFVVVNESASDSTHSKPV